LRVPLNVRRPCMVTKLSTRATSPRCHGTLNDSSSANSVATLTASRSSGAPSPNVIAFALKGGPRSVEWAELRRRAERLESALDLPFPRYLSRLRAMNRWTARELIIVP